MDVCHIGQTTSHRDAGMRMPMGTPPSPQQPTQTYWGHTQAITPSRLLGLRLKISAG